MSRRLLGLLTLLLAGVVALALALALGEDAPPVRASQGPSPVVAIGEPSADGGEAEDCRDPTSDDVKATPRLKMVEVVDERERPLPDALVVVLLAEGGEARGVTDAAGRARFDSLEADGLRVRRAGYFLGEARGKGESVRVQLSPSEVAGGTALLPSGAPAAGARIRAWDKDEEDLIDLEQTTRDDGRFLLTGVRPDHPVVVIGRLDGFAPVRCESLATDVTLRFGEGVRVRGRVVPVVEGAEIALVSRAFALYWAYAQSEAEFDSLALAPVPRTRTDAEGRFAVQGVAAGRYDVFARASDGARGAATVTVAGDSEIEVRVRKPALVTIRVLTPDGDEAQDPHCVVRGGELAAAGDPVELEAGRQRITAFGEGHRWAQAEIEVAAGEERTVEIRLRQGLRVAGRVLDGAGRAIGGADVDIGQEVDAERRQSQRARSDAEGAWGISGLGDLQLQDGVTLHLTVLDAEGRPIRGAHVEVREPVYKTGLRTDARGQCTVAHQAPKLALRIDAAGHATAYRDVDATLPAALRLERGVLVSGRVLGPGGEPIPAAYVVFHPVGDDTQCHEPDVDGLGRFTLLLPAGSYRVQTYGEGRQQLIDRFEAAEGAAFELRLR